MAQYLINIELTNQLTGMASVLGSTQKQKYTPTTFTKLKDFEGRVFIVPDEPDVRRQKVLDRIKKRAEREGKLVVVANGVLSVDGVNVYSLKDGRIA